MERPSGVNGVFIIWLKHSLKFNPLDSLRLQSGPGKLEAELNLSGVHQMSIFKALFWVVAVSFLLAGRNGISSSFENGPASEYLGPDAPAVQSSETIVAKVSELRGICGREETICDVTGSIANFGLRFIDQVLAQFLSEDAYRQLDAPKKTGGERRNKDLPDFDFLDSVNELFYSAEEELEDIG